MADDRTEQAGSVPAWEVRGHPAPAGEPVPAWARIGEPMRGEEVTDELGRPESIVSAAEPRDDD